ncbi:thermonuclease family protein [Paracoccus beibuensis]|uniref:thermonuclease family protein n=1 Tax=Paracoccus beibuensis TaxID=547602 RepID=UPI00223F68C1|nr:thermonuclease family protein [Paracoccus beibuensis]
MRKARFGPGAAIGAVLMVAILAGLADEWDDEAREVFSPLTRDDFQIIVGQARVVDGDTLDVNGAPVRLFGIDAVEKGQLCQDTEGYDWNCGHRAADELARKLEGREVRCVVKDTDKYDRAVADCEAGGLSLNYWAVRSGWAVAYTRYSRAYENAEAEARADGTGIFAGAFMEPQEWRAKHK